MRDKLRLVEEDATQLFRLDTRGFSALDYAPQETWPAWCAFLDRVKRELRAALKQSASPLAAAASPLVPFAHSVSPTRKKASRAVPPAAPGAAAPPAPSPDSPPPRARPEDAAAMARVLGAFNSGEAGTPLGTVAAACKSAMADLGDAVKVLVGPPKKEKGVLEKARDGGHDRIRDYARLSLIVADDDRVPDVVRRLASRAEFGLVRAKNRLDEDYDARESADYRDN